MVRSPFFDKNGLKRGLWSDDEDNKLRAYIQKYGHWNWRQLPKYAGLSRCGKSCRLRWMNYLRPNLKTGNYSEEEEDMIMKLHHKHGNKWSVIAAHLPGRTDNDIKNYRHTRLKRRVKLNPISKVTVESSVSFQPKPNQNEKFNETSLSERKKARESELENVVADTTSHQTLESTLSHPKEFPSDISSSSMSTNLRSIDWPAEEMISFNSLEYFAESLGNFWSEPFLVDTFYDQQYYSPPSTEGGFMSPYMFYNDDDISFFE
ncbi:unnamed protein product [Ilex paraguariensis]|uniref:Uncharacterized protein n=1 Tax=Ilex paraguariensis TaxID=185542 RepID=A0ABC8T1R6_9AQUA